MKLTRKNILITVAVCALAVRLIFAWFFSSSYFAGYHRVPGLDMQTLLRFSEWNTGKDTTPFFTFHRLLIYLDWIIGGRNHHVWLIFAVQNLTGILGTLCIADTIRKLSGNRIAALAGGIAAGLYLPFMVYEFSILQECFMVNFALFAFWGMLNALHKRFSPASSLIFAAGCFAASAGRPAAVFFIGAMLLFCGYKMRRKLKKTVPFAAVLAGFFLFAMIFNRITGGNFSPFYNVMPYTLEYNADPATPQKQSTVFQAAKNAASRVPTLFKYGELPENQNIYFWCEKIPVFHLLIAPGLLIPLAAAGIMVILFSGAWKKRYGLLLLPVITLALPLCAREAIGRYRLMLVPYFFMISGCAAVIFLKLKAPRQRGIILFGAGAGAFFSIYQGDVPMRIRQSDYSAYAIAMEHTPGAYPTAVVDAYYDYWQAHNFRSEYAYRMIMDKSLKYKAFETAATASSQALANGINPDLIRYYLAWSFALQENPQEVYNMLSGIRNPASLPEELRPAAVKLWNDTIRIMRMRQRMR